MPAYLLVLVNTVVWSVVGDASVGRCEHLCFFCWWYVNHPFVLLYVCICCACMSFVCLSCRYATRRCAFERLPTEAEVVLRGVRVVASALTRMVSYG